MTRLLAGALVLAALLALPACTPDPTVAQSAAGSPVVPAVGERVGRSPVAVLQQWDRRRARAWAAGDLRGLRALYVRGSRAGERDVAMLRRWSSRGLSVEGLAVQVLRGRVVSRSPRRLTVEVSERLVGASASAGQGRWALPAGSPATRRVTLWRVGGTWRVASVVGLPARSVAGGES